MVAGQSIGAWVLDVLLGILCVGAWSIAVGWAGPRWPTSWLRRDRGPLRLLPGDTPDRYRALGARWLRRHFPEMGAVFGGVSKNIPPDFADIESVHDYLAEVRRAEWVHWVSMLGWLPLPFFQPWGLAAAFLLITVVVNGIAEVILRYNKVRLYLLLDAMGGPRFG